MTEKRKSAATVWIKHIFFFKADSYSPPETVSIVSSWLNTMNLSWWTWDGSSLTMLMGLALTTNSMALLHSKQLHTETPPTYQQPKHFPAAYTWFISMHAISGMPWSGPMLVCEMWMEQVRAGDGRLAGLWLLMSSLVPSHQFPFTWHPGSLLRGIPFKTIICQQSYFQSYGMSRCSLTRPHLSRSPLSSCPLLPPSTSPAIQAWCSVFRLVALVFLGEPIQSLTRLRGIRMTGCVEAKRAG